MAARGISMWGADDGDEESDREELAEELTAWAEDVASTFGEAAGCSNDVDMTPAEPLAAAGSSARADRASAHAEMLESPTCIRSSGSCLSPFLSGSVVLVV